MLRLQDLFLLLSAFLFGLAISPNFTRHSLYFTLAILHVLVYPVTNLLIQSRAISNKSTWWTGIVLGLLSIGVSLIALSRTFALGLLVYYIPAVMWKDDKSSTMRAGIFSGAYRGTMSFLIAYIGINLYSFSNLLEWRVIVPALVCGLLFASGYPYLWREAMPSKRVRSSGGRGVKSIFLFACLLIGTGIAYFLELDHGKYLALFMVSVLLSSGAAVAGLTRVNNASKESEIGGKFTWSALAGMVWNLFLGYLFLDHSHILQAIRSGF